MKHLLILLSLMSTVGFAALSEPTRFCMCMGQGLNKGHKLLRYEIKSGTAKITSEKKLSTHATLAECVAALQANPECRSSH